MGEEEAAHEDGGGGAYLGGQLAELGGTEGLDGVEAQQQLLLSGGEEVGQGRPVVAAEAGRVDGDIGGGGSRADLVLGSRSIGTRRVGRAGGRDGGQGRYGGRDSFRDVLLRETIGFGSKLGKLAR